MVVDFESLDLEQTRDEFDFSFYIEVTISGVDFVMYETLELLVLQVRKIHCMSLLFIVSATCEIPSMSPKIVPLLSLVS